MEDPIIEVSKEEVNSVALSLSDFFIRSVPRYFASSILASLRNNTQSAHRCADRSVVITFFFTRFVESVLRHLKEEGNIFYGLKYFQKRFKV